MCVAMCCNVLQCVAACSSVLQWRSQSRYVYVLQCVVAVYAYVAG